MITQKQARACTLVLRHILYGEKTSLDSRTDWNELKQIIQLHTLSSMVDCSDDPALAPIQEKQNVFGHLLYRRTMRQTIRVLFLEMEKRNIKAALLKGTALESCFPPGVVRTCGDIDIFVPGAQRQAFTQMMADMDIAQKSNIHNGQTGVDSYITPAGFEIEAHYIIYYRMGAFQRKLLRQNGYFSDRYFVPGDDPEIPYQTFSPNAHLLYLVYHSSKHLLSHDLSFRMLADLTMYVNRYGEEIDWPAFQNLLKQLSLTRLANAQFCFCEDYLGMRSDCWKRTGPSMERFLRMMMCSGSEHLWEIPFIKQYVWVFYSIECLEKDNEYYIRYTSHPFRAFKSLRDLIIFIAWRLVRLLWGYRVDTSGEMA
jgi:hypothetical protein